MKKNMNRSLSQLLVNCQPTIGSLPTDSWQCTDKWKYELSEGSFMLQTPLFHGSFHCESLLFLFILKPPILGSRIQQELYSSNSSTLSWNKCIIQIAWFYGWTNILDSGFVIINENLLFRFRFSDSMTICLKQICGYTDLCCEVEKLRKEAYSSDNATHEEKLMQVWVNYYNV